MAQMTLTPVMINLLNQRVVIVGGGSVAERRVLSLQESGADLIIVSPELTQTLHLLWRQGDIEWRKKHFEPTDIVHAFLVIVATNCSKINQKVKASVPRNVLLNMAVDSEMGNVQFPGKLKQGRLTISVSTGGASPMLTSKLIQDLKVQYNDRFVKYVDFLYECRNIIKHSTLDDHHKKAWFKKLLLDSFMDNEIQQKTLDELKELAHK